MRVKNVRKTRKSIHEAAEEFISFKTARKVRERTISEYCKYLDDFIQESSDSLEMDDLKRDLLRYCAAIPDTSPARFNHPYQYPPEILQTGRGSVHALSVPA